jgi:cytochrome c biogenesis protein CcdA
MELIAFVAGLAIVFGLFALLAGTFGSDSRPWINDDWRRLY